MGNSRQKVWITAYMFRKDRFMTIRTRMPLIFVTVFEVTGFWSRNTMPKSTAVSWNQALKQGWRLSACVTVCLCELAIVWNILMWKTMGSLMAVNQDLCSSARNWVPHLALYLVYSLSFNGTSPGLTWFSNSLIPTMVVPVWKLKGDLNSAVNICQMYDYIKS